MATQLAACKKQLSTLPPLVTVDPSAFVFNLVVTFCQEVFQHVDGSPAHTQLVQANKATYGRFKTSIRHTAPAFVPFKEDEVDPNQVAEFTKPDDESDAIEEQGSHPTRPEMYLEEVRRRIRAFVIPITWRRTFVHIMCSAITRELPNNVPYAAKRAFIRDFQETWGQHTMICFDRVQETFKSMLAELIKDRFSRFSNLKAVIA